MNITVSGYSTALFSTWFFIEELGLLFDAGDGVSAALLQKAGKIKHVFITHADRDHLGGLLQFNQLNSKPGSPIIHYPKDCGSFPALEAFSKKFDPQVAGSVWKPIVSGEKTWIRKDVYVEALRNSHVAAGADVHKSLGYKVVLVKQKLNADILALPLPERKKAIAEQGKTATHTEELTTLLAYSGDTPVENFEQWDGAQILIHEATFMRSTGEDSIKKHGNKHSTLEELMQALASIKVENLIISHFSSRYTEQEIREYLALYQKMYNIKKCNIFLLLPGKMVWDITNANIALRREIDNF
jgi:ribonuclease Z